MFWTRSGTGILLHLIVDKPVIVSGRGSKRMQDIWIRGKCLTRGDPTNSIPMSVLKENISAFLKGPWSVTFGVALALAAENRIDRVSIMNDA